MRGLVYATCGETRATADGASLTECAVVKDGCQNFCDEQYSGHAVLVKFVIVSSQQDKW